MIKILHDLSGSSWILLAVTTAFIFAFLARIPMRRWDNAAAHAAVIGLLLIATREQLEPIGGGS